MNNEKYGIPNLASAALTIEMWARKNNQTADDVMEMFNTGRFAFTEAGRLPPETECPVVYFTADAAPLTAHQVDKIENYLMTKPLTVAQRESTRIALVAEFRALNAMGVQPADRVCADMLQMVLKEVRAISRQVKEANPLVSTAVCR